MKINLLLLIFLFSCSFTEGTEKEEDYLLDEIVITMTRRPHILANTPVETNLITYKEIKAAGIQTIADAIRWIPGLNISGGAPFGASRRYTGMIRGLPAQYSLVLIDGMRTKSEHIHTGINLTTLPADMIKKIEVVKGAGSAIYGSDAFGGVINIITKDIPEEMFIESNISYGSFDTKDVSINFGKGLDKFSYLFSSKLTDSGGVNNVWYKQRNLLAKSKYTLTETDTLNFVSKYYYNNYIKGTTGVIDNMIDGSLTWTRSLGLLSSIKAGCYLNRFTASLRDTVNSDSEINVLYQTEFSNNHFVTSGLEIKQEEFQRTATPNKNQVITSLFVEDEFRITAPLKMLLAMRLDNHPGPGTVFTPKANILYRLNSLTNLRVSVGKGFRAPSLQDLYEYHYFHNTYWRDGNPGLKPEYSQEYSVGLESQFIEKKVATRISCFRNNITNMITVVDTGQVEDGFPIMQRENLKTAYTQGIDLEAKYRISGFTAVLGYAFLDSKDNDGKVISYSPKHLLNFRLTHTVERFGIGMYLSIEDVKERYYKNKQGQVEKLDDYTLINCNITKDISEKLYLFLNIGNIFNQIFESYEEGKTQAGFGRTFRTGINIKF